MPVYEYECEVCHKNMEFIQKFSDPPMQECPHCGGRLRKLISNTSFVLKGSGWYADGYATPAPDAKEQKKDGKGDKGDKGKKAAVGNGKKAGGAGGGGAPSGSGKDTKKAGKTEKADK